MNDDTLRRTLRDGDPLAAAPELDGDAARRMHARVMAEAATAGTRDARPGVPRLMWLRAAVAFASIAAVVGAIAWIVARSHTTTPIAPTASVVARVEAPVTPSPDAVSPQREPKPAAHIATTPPAARGVAVAAVPRRGGACPALPARSAGNGRNELTAHVVRQMHLIGPNGTRIILMIGDAS